MSAFRKKPVVIEACQLPPIADIDGRMAFDDWACRNGGENGALHYMDENISMTTIHGETAIGRPGDWIVKELEPGRFYPVKQHIFAATYEAARPNTQTEQERP